MVLLLLLSLSFLLLVLLYLQFRWRHRHILALANKLPCPPAWPLIGNALFFRDYSSATRNLLRFFQVYKTPFCIWVGPEPIFVISDPSDVQIILNSSATLEKDKWSNSVKHFFGNGLLTAPASIWKKYRRIINPLFHPSNIENFLPVFNELARNLVQEIDALGGTLDPTDLFYHSAIHAISRTTISKKRYDKSMGIKFEKAMHNMAKVCFEIAFNPLLGIKWVQKLIRNEVQYAHELYCEVLEYYDKLWKEEINNQEYSKGEKYGSEELSYKTLLNLSLENPSVPGESHDWKDELTTLIAAGSDTVVSALSFLSITLANHPDVQDKIHREIEEIVGDTSEVTLSDLRSLKYLDQVIMEGMRLHTTAPLIMRQATKSVKLSTFTLPAGSRVMISIFSMSRDEDQFPQPEKFLPDRFSPDALEKRHPYSFLPFSGGPRNCIGKTYAMLFMKTVMVHLMRKYKMHSDVRLNDIEYDLKVVLSPKSKLPIRFENK